MKSEPIIVMPMGGFAAGKSTIVRQMLLEAYGGTIPSVPHPEDPVYRFNRYGADVSVIGDYSGTKTTPGSENLLRIKKKDWLFKTIVDELELERRVVFELASLPGHQWFKDLNENAKLYMVLINVNEETRIAGMLNRRQSAGNNEPLAPSTVANLRSKHKAHVSMTMKFRPVIHKGSRVGAADAVNAILTAENHLEVAESYAILKA